MNKGEAAEVTDAPKVKSLPASASAGSTRSDTPVDNEDDKERAIAKAALTIAELSQCFSSRPVVRPSHLYNSFCPSISEQELD